MNVSIKVGLLAALVTGLLGGCGGGASSSPVLSASTVSGTAATGAAIAGGSVSMSCVSGVTGIATTAADGGYSLSASGFTFPCVVRVTYGTEKLHSFISAAGTANITPVTELLVANLTGGSALDAFDKFDGTKAKALTAAQVTAAIAAVKAYLVTLGVSVIDFPADPIGVKFVARVGTAEGDKVDKVLDDLQARLQVASKKLSDAVADINKSTSSSPASSTAAAGGVGCTGDALAFFTKNKGSYPVVADLYTPGPLGAAATVAGIKDKGATTVIVSDNCTVTVGAKVFTYKNGSLSKSPDGQIDTEISATGFSTATYEVFGPAVGGGLVSLGDSTTGAFGNFFTK